MGRKVRHQQHTARREHPRCLDDPAPVCFLRTFGDSSINFLLYFWVGNIVDGRWGPQSEVMFAIWRKFRENGIEIPFPQRDLHIRTGLPGQEGPLREPGGTGEPDETSEGGDG